MPVPLGRDNIALVVGRVWFEHDRSLDVVEALFESYELASEAGVVRWRQEVERGLARFGRKVDLLIRLDGLVVRPAACRFFGEHRSQVLARHTHQSFRYGGDGATRTTVFTSSVLHGAEANVYPTRQAALDALLEARAARR